MKKSLDDSALDQLFRSARSINRWSADPVPTERLHALYDLLKFGPTSLNCCPARFVFVTSAASRAKLVECVSPGNVIKVEQAPVSVIIGMDEQFFEKLPYLFPARPDAGNAFKDSAIGRVTMIRNATLQGAYLMLAARSLGLDCGPMSGFNNDQVDAAFFSGTSVKSNFLCGLGTGTEEMMFPRNPRLPFDEACRIV